MIAVVKSQESREKRVKMKLLVFCTEIDFSGRRAPLPLSVVSTVPYCCYVIVS